MEDKTFDSFIFTHIPKCGGTSFRQIINESALKFGIPKEEIYIPGFNNLNTDRNLEQLNEQELKDLGSNYYKVFANHCKFNVHSEYNLKIKSPYYFTILRNPISRFVSHYNFFYYKLGYQNCKGKSLNDLKEETLDFLINKLANTQIIYVSNIKHIKILGYENLLKVAKYNIQYEYNSFAILEEIENLNHISEMYFPEWLKLRNIKFPNINSNKSTYDLKDCVIDKIVEANKYDIDFYNFSKNILTERVQ